MRNHDPLNDSGGGANQAHEAQRRAALASETQLGTHTNGTAMARPGATTLAAELTSPRSKVGPFAQVQRTIASSECDVANLETANRSGDFMRASWAQASVERFIGQIPQLLKMAPQGTSEQLTALVHTLEMRARAALDSAPKISAAAREAAQRGDYAQWNADLAPWLAKANVSSNAPPTTESAARAPVPVLQLGHDPTFSDQRSEIGPSQLVEGEQLVAPHGTLGAGGSLPHTAVQRQSLHTSARHSAATSDAHTMAMSQSATAPGAVSLEPEIHQIEQATKLEAQIRGSMIPAYRHAIDMLDAPTARELAGATIAAVQAVLQAQIRMDAAVKAGRYAVMASTPDSSTSETPETAQHRYDQLVASANNFDIDLARLIADLAVQLGPQIYKGTLVLGKIEHPRLGKEPIEYLSHEAMTMLSLLEVIHRVRVIPGAAGQMSTELNAAHRAQIAALVEPWHSRPVNYAFLVQALRDIGVWDNIASASTAWI